MVTADRLVGCYSPLWLHAPARLLTVTARGTQVGGGYSSGTHFQRPLNVGGDTHGYSLASVRLLSLVVHCFFCGGSGGSASLHRRSALGLFTFKKVFMNDSVSAVAAISRRSAEECGNNKSLGNGTRSCDWWTGANRTRLAGADRWRDGRRSAQPH